MCGVSIHNVGGFSKTKANKIYTLADGWCHKSTPWTKVHFWRFYCCFLLHCLSILPILFHSREGWGLQRPPPYPSSFKILNWRKVSVPVRTTCGSCHPTEQKLGVLITKMLFLGVQSLFYVLLWGGHLVVSEYRNFQCPALVCILDL